MKKRISNMSTFHFNNRQNEMDGKESVHKKTITNIKNELKRQKFIYESFAELFGKGQSWFSHIMTGRTKLTIQLLYEIAEKLGVDPVSLLPGKNPYKKPTFEEYMWDTLKKRLDKYFDEKFEQKLKEKK